MTKKQCDGYLDEIQENLDGDLLREMVRVIVQSVMEEEIARHVSAGRHERSGDRKGYRNGYKPRTFNTRVGKLELEVPQARGMEPYSPLLFAKWQRSERALLVACAEMYFMGVSTRKVANVLEKMGGFELSAATVSCVAQELDEKLQEFRNRRLDEHTWPYLMVDACYTKTRKNGYSDNRAVLIVAGVNDDGRREILAWYVCDRESEDTWSEIFGELHQRGVRGVRWITSDGHKGIQAAVTTQFPKARWQRCWVHFMRNALDKVGHKQRNALAKELTAVRKIDDLKICLAEAERVAQRWEKRYPRLAEQIRGQFEETLAVHALPQEHKRRIYTTNILERVMREIKRRIHVVGLFPNDAACDRLVGAVLVERHEAWQAEPARYLSMEHLDRNDSTGRKSKAA